MKKYDIGKFYIEIWKKTYVDPSLQRRLVWKDTNKRLYLESLFRGVAYSPMMVADIQSCLDFCEAELERANTTETSSDRLQDLRHSKKYFKHALSKGYRYISIDGQNRSDAVAAFLKNLINIQKVSFRTPRALYNFKKKTFYQDLDPQARDYLDAKELVRVTIISGHTRKELEQIFVQVNEGVALNDMEKTSAVDSPMGRFIRECSEVYRAAFEGIKKVVDWKRKDDQDWLCKIAKIVKYNGEQNTKVVDHRSFWTEETLSKKEKEIVNLMLKDFQDVSSYGTVNTKWQLWSIFMTLYELHRNFEYTLSDNTKFLKFVVSYVSNEMDKSDQQYGSDLTSFYKNQSGKKPGKSEYFSHWVSNSDVAAQRQKWVNIVMFPLLTQLINNGIIKASSSSILDDVEELTAAAA